jgi:MFS transporter, OCT family, solute carrier family 22 (organic cation transporter), member 4/5
MIELQMNCSIIFTFIYQFQWNLTCTDNQWKLALVGTAHFAGIMVGSAIFGFVADHFGRKLIFVVAIIAMSLTGIAQAVSTSYIMFLTFSFLNAVGTSGVYPLAFVLGLEMVGKKKREMSGVILNYFYSIGEALVGFIAWLDGDWVNLQYWVSAPPILFVAYYWIVPESIRWLLAKNSNQEALKIIKQAAHANGVELSQGLLAKFEEEMTAETDKTSIQITTKYGTESVSQPASYRSLLRSKVLIIRCLILFFIW